MLHFGCFYNNPIIYFNFERLFIYLLNFLFCHFYFFSNKNELKSESYYIV